MEGVKKLVFGVGGLFAVTVCLIIALGFLIPRPSFDPSLPTIQARVLAVHMGDNPKLLVEIDGKRKLIDIWPADMVYIPGDTVKLQKGLVVDRVEDK